MSIIGCYKESPQFVKDFIMTTVKHEGSYVDDPNDSGGKTNWGITYKTALKFKDSWNLYNWDGDMKTMPMEFAKDVYAYDYFYIPRFNLVAKESELIAQELFDTGVNTGTSRPSRWLQELLNVFNNNQSYYGDISEDGIIGKGTCSAFKSFLNKRGKKGEEVLYNALNIKQGAFYIDLATRRSKDEKFVWGWLVNRTDFK